jgi:hypothetical protein
MAVTVMSITIKIYRYEILTIRPKYLMPTIGGYELHSIPIKTTNDYSTFTALVDEAILAAQQNNYETLRIKMKEIDKIVYDIYGLTDAEIKIIEQSI